MFCVEHGDLRGKTEALKRVIQMILNGEKVPGLLMTVIRFVMPMQDHIIKKMLLIFWEVVPKYTPDGKMLHEFILVCDAYRKVYTKKLYHRYFHQILLRYSLFHSKLAAVLHAASCLVISIYDLDKH